MENKNTLGATVTVELDKVSTTSFLIKVFIVVGLLLFLNKLMKKF